MSDRNVEIVRAAFTAWNAGDMDSLRDFYDPDVLMRPPEGWPEPGPFVGRDAVMRYFEELRGTWDHDVQNPISDFVDGGDRVAVRTVWRAIGKGPEYGLHSTLVFTVRRGKILGLELFWDHEEALEIVGVSGPSPGADPS